MSRAMNSFVHALRIGHNKVHKVRDLCAWICWHNS